MRVRRRRRSGRAAARTPRPPPSRPRATRRGSRSRRDATLRRCRRARSSVVSRLRWSSASTPMTASAISSSTCATASSTPLPPKRVAAVAELDGLVGAGARAARYRGPPRRARGQLDLHLDGGVAAGVEDLPSGHVDDDAHGSSRGRGPGDGGASSGSDGAGVVGVTNLAACLVPAGESQRCCPAAGVRRRAVRVGRGRRRVRRLRARERQRRPGRAAPRSVPRCGREGLGADEALSEAGGPAPQHGFGVDALGSGGDHGTGQEVGRARSRDRRRSGAGRRRSSMRSTASSRVPGSRPTEAALRKSLCA